MMSLSHESAAPLQNLAQGKEDDGSPFLMMSLSHEDVATLPNSCTRQKKMMAPTSTLLPLSQEAVAPLQVLAQGKEDDGGLRDILTGQIFAQFSARSLQPSTKKENG